MRVRCTYGLVVQVSMISHKTIMSIPWILVLYKKRGKIAEAVSFLLLVIVGRRSATESRGQGICRRQTGCAAEMAAAQSSRGVVAGLPKIQVDWSRGAAPAKSTSCQSSRVATLCIL